MKRIISSPLLWGLLLVIGGVILLLSSLKIITGSELFWTVFTAVAGLLFLIEFLTNHAHWWSLIPGVILLAIAAIIGIEKYAPHLSNTTPITGVIILGGIGLSFLLVYLVNHLNWWAIIPAGVMGTIAVVSVFDASAYQNASGGIFFLGLGITFALVAILPNPIGRMRWSWIPAIILGIFGIVLLIARADLINYIWPSVLVLLGIFFIIRAVVRRKV